MSIHYPFIPFERYADTICHCRNLEESQRLKALILYVARAEKEGESIRKSRLIFWIIHFNLELRETDMDSFFNGYSPAISKKSRKHIREKMRCWNLNRRVQIKLSDIAVGISAEVRGWINYYGKFYSSSLKSFLQEINLKLAR
jgi:hypothetical protein